jgi:hypothetical protein
LRRSLPGNVFKLGETSSETVGHVHTLTCSMVHILA